MQDDMRRKAGERASLIGILCNLGLFLLKLFVSLFSGSMSVMADSFNNLSDSLSSAVSLMAVRISSRPADRDHPYGHGRMEYIASFTISLVILLVGADLLKTSIQRILEPEAIRLQPWTFFFLGFTVLVKFLLFVYNRRVGRKAELKVLELSGRDALFDCLSTLLTMASLLVYRFFSLDLDAWAGILLSLVIVSSGVRLVLQAISPLLGTRTDTELLHALTDLASSVPQVMGVHDVQLHDYGYHITVGSMHVELADTLTFAQAHRIADEIEQKALEKLNVKIVVHEDPISSSSLRARLLKETEEKLASLDPGLSIHDFQLDTAGEESALSFDILFPYRYSQADTEQVCQKIKASLADAYPSLLVSVRPDRGEDEDT